MATTTTTNYRKNQGRVYKCGKVATTSATTTTVTTLLDHLCTVTSRGFGKAAWRRRILRGEIAVDQVIVTDIDFALTRQNQVVSYHRPPWNEPVAVLQTVPMADDDGNGNHHPHDDPNALKILYQDEHLMAVHKPSGLPTMHSQTFVEYTVLNVLRTHAAAVAAAAALVSSSNNSSSNNNSTVQQQAPPQPVHRLGVGTSGVMLIATSLPARKALCLAIREKQVKKVYRALVCGADIPDSVRVDCPIGPVPFPIGGGTIYAACPTMTTTDSGESDDPLRNNNETTTQNNDKAKASLSLVQVVRRNFQANQAVVDVEIPTGRPHQIRIHMAYLGHPLVGDPLYLSGGVPDREPRLFPKRSKEDEDMDTDEEEGGGGEDGVMRVALPRDCGYSLHAHQVTVEHPTLEGKRMTFTAIPPANLT